MKNIIFMAVDCLKDFIEPNGALYVTGAETIKPNLKKLTSCAGANNIKIIYTCDSHLDTDEEISINPDYETTFPPHCMKYTTGAEAVEEVSISNKCRKTTIFSSKKDFILDSVGCDNLVLLKDKFDVFEGNVNTDELLKSLPIDTVVVYGVATDICVKFAVAGLKKRGYQVIVILDAIKALSEEVAEELFEEWADKGVDMFSTDAIIEYIKNEKVS